MGNKNIIIHATNIKDLGNIRIDSSELIERGYRVILYTRYYSYTTALISLGEIPEYDLSVNRKIKIGNNVFTGTDSIIMSGTTIEDNVIIGAGNVIRETIKKDSVYIGNHGQIIANIQDHAKKNEIKDFQFKLDNKNRTKTKLTN
jgi:acetyltransferase-like isoleucine patch superfamily enzyme